MIRIASVSSGFGNNVYGDVSICGNEKFFEKSFPVGTNTTIPDMNGKPYFKTNEKVAIGIIVSHDENHIVFPVVDDVTITHDIKDVYTVECAEGTITIHGVKQ